MSAPRPIRSNRTARCWTRPLRAAALAVSAALIAGPSLLAGSPAAAAPDLTPGPGQWFIDDYGIDEMWKTTTGEGVRVAVIDSGIDDGHENLTGKVVDAADFSGAGRDGRTPVGPEATIHHGTAVAGVIAGNGSGAGPTGVAPDAELLSASMWLGGDSPAASDSTRVQAQRALRWAVDHDADVVNMSLGWNDPTWPSSWDDAFDYAFSHDVVVIACVGNRSQGATQAWSPATVPGVVGVGGLGESGQVRDTSSAPGIAVDLMAPAEAIPVPMHTGGYGTAQGCSFAAPIVSGVAALIRAQHREMSADEVVAALTSTAAPVPGHDGRTDSSGPDPIVGYGAIRPLDALGAQADASAPSAEKQLEAWVAMHRRGEPADAEGAAEGETASAADGGGAQTDGEVIAEADKPTVGPIVLIGGFALGLAAFALAGAGVVQKRRLSAARRAAEARWAEREASQAS